MTPIRATVRIPCPLVVPNFVCYRAYHATLHKSILEEFSVY